MWLNDSCPTSYINSFKVKIVMIVKVKHNKKQLKYGETEYQNQLKRTA